MSAGAIGGATAAAGAAAAVSQAIRASGVLVRIEPDDFERLVNGNKDALVIHTEGGFFGKCYQYLTSYKGLAFYTKSGCQLSFPKECELIYAKKMWIPG